MKKSLIVLTAVAGLLVAGCSSNRGGAYDQQNSSYNRGTTENPNPNLPPNDSGGPERGPGTGGMGGTSTAPGGTSNGSATSGDTDTAPSAPDSGSQNNGSQSPR
jgi:hypothetical protein